MKNKVKIPLFHIVKRKDLPWWRRWIVRAIAIILALIVCGIVTMLLTGANPFDIYGAMLHGAFGTGRKIWVLFQNMAILLCISLALAPAFKMRFWNLGGDGQTIIGGLAAAACMICLGDVLPNWLLIIVMIIAAIVAGAIWAVIPALCKAKWRTNETLFTLMMNYVAIQLVAFFVIIWENPKGASKIGIINQSTEAGWLPQIGDYKYLLNIIIVLILTAAMFVYMRYSKHGYEIAVVGESEPTARYIGIKVKKVIIRTMILSGAICGIAGLLIVAGTDHTLTTTIVDNRGFTGVMVCWLANFNPIVMIFTSLLLVFMSRGAAEITTLYGFNQSFGDILTGIILFFIIGCEFFIRYRLEFRHKQETDIAGKAKVEEVA